MSLLEDEIASIPPASPTAAQDAPAPKVNFFSVLRNGGFRNLWLGQIISQIGDYFSLLALMVIISGFSPNAEQTTLAITGLMISATLPRLLFGLLAGVFVDRWDRRRTMIVSDVVRSGLAVLMIPAFLVYNLPVLYALTFLMAAVGTLFNPAKGALIPKLVPSEQLLAANSVSQTSQILAMLIGPALAGSTLAIVGTANEWIALVVDGLSFVVSAGAIWLIRIPAELSKPTIVDGRLTTDDDGEAVPGSAVGRVWKEYMVGLKALVLNRTMASLAIIFAFTMLGVGAINVLFVVYLKTRFGFDGSELAWRLSLADISFAAGMIVASVLVGNFMANIAPKWFIVVALVGTGAGLALCVAVPDYWLFLVANVVLGIFVAPIETGAGTLMQIVVPNNQLGRVGGGFATIADSATILSMSLAGAVGALIGIPMVFTLAGVLCAAMGLLAWVVLPAVTLKDKVDDSAPQVEASPSSHLKETGSQAQTT